MPMALFGICLFSILLSIRTLVTIFKVPVEPPMNTGQPQLYVDRPGKPALALHWAHPPSRAPQPAGVECCLDGGFVYRGEQMNVVGSTHGRAPHLEWVEDLPIGIGHPIKSLRT